MCYEKGKEREMIAILLKDKRERKNSVTKSVKSDKSLLREVEKKSPEKRKNERKRKRSIKRKREKSVERKSKKNY